MASTEELTVLIKTIPDTSGAKEVQRSLLQTQATAKQVGQSLTPRQQGANFALRSAMGQEQATLENFNKIRSGIIESLETAPTLKPEDFGIKPEVIAAAGKAAADAGAKTEAAHNAAAKAAKGASDATKAVGTTARASATDVERFSAAALGVGVSLSLWTAAGAAAHSVLSTLVQGFTEFEQAQRANTVTLGNQAAGFQQWARTVSEEAGFTERSLLEAGTAAAQFGRQLGFGPQQTQQLVALATLTARIQGSDPSKTITQLTSAIQGNAQAAAALNLQLDASFIAYTQLGGSQAAVFDQLDAGTQATLRYAAAQEQIARQAQQPTTATQDLAKAVSEFNAQVEKLAKTEGPGFVKSLTDITREAAGFVKGFREADEWIIKATADLKEFRAEVLKGATGAEPTDSPLERTAKLLPRLIPGVGMAVDAFGKLNSDIRDVSGFDAKATAINAVGSAVTSLKQASQGLGEALAGPFLGAANAAKEARADAAAARGAQLAATREELAGPLAVLDAARQNEIEAARALVSYQDEIVQRTADEARIRLSMLPATQEMARLQNEVAQAQLIATQRALPAARGLQDLQNQIRMNTLIAQSADRSMRERQDALRTATELTRRLPEAEIGALGSQMQALPAQRAAQDVAAAAQLQGLQLAQALFPDQFRVDQLTLLSQIAQAAKAASERTMQLTIQAINVILEGAGVTLSDDNFRQISDLVGSSVAAAIHNAVQTVNQRGAPNQLLGATGA